MTVRRPRRGPGSNQYADRPPLPPRDPATDTGRVDPAAAATDDPLGRARPDAPWGLLDDHPSLTDVRDRFAAADVELHVVGGPVRDLIDQGHPGNDLDLCTPADVDTVKGLVDDLGSVPPAGQEFGTVRLCREGHPDVEITTFRGESYRDESRKPTTWATTDLDDDLSRRDFTVNAMAYDLTTGRFSDPYGGLDDLDDGVLRAVGDPDARFSDDPLRIVRLARFAALRGWSVDAATGAAARQQAHRLLIVSRERTLTETRKVIDRNPEAFGRYLGVLRDAAATDHVAPHVDCDPDQWQGADRLTTPAAVWGRIARSSDDPNVTLSRMKASNDETNTAKTVAGVARSLETGTHLNTTVRKHDDATIRAAQQVLRSVGQTHPQLPSPHVREALRAPLPVDGNDALDAGLQGRDIGDALRRVETAFVDAGGRLDRDTALGLLTAPR